jgi:hypothetical protein
MDAQGGYYLFAYHEPYLELNGRRLDMEGA